MPLRSERFVKTIAPRHSGVARPAPIAAVAGFETRSHAGGPPAGIAFLASYGVPPARLIAAARLAHQQGVSADRALLANGIVDETFFYQCLARHLGVAFIDEPVRLLDVDGAYRQAIHAGLVPFEDASGVTWLGAPRGDSLATLMRNARRGGGLAARLAITTPSLLSRWVQMKAHRRMSADASFALLSADADLCAHGRGPLPHPLFGLSAISIFCVSFLSPVLPAASVLPVLSGAVFLAAIIFRLFVSAAALGTPVHASRKLEDCRLPSYTILVALYKEARVVKRLVRMLDRIDYPRAKLEIKMIVEEDDEETRRALAALPLGPVYEVIVAPPGTPRTKPRALNVALPLAKGSLIAVFDAEDAPDPQQLRRAAERFAAAPPELACLQARLAIDNSEDNWLTRLYAIEYAALFHLQNTGLADLGLPLPLSGTSNHFRTSVLHAIHGWDAWNVTEDADIGLRLARFGYSAGVLESATYEEAPVSFDAWVKQRRRWYKGWFQTFITISRSPLGLIAELGIKRSAGVVLLLLGLLLGPLFWLPASLFAVDNLVQRGWQAPFDLPGFCIAVLWSAVGSLGAASLFWPALLGMKRQGLLHLWPVLSLFPIYYCLHTLAAWMALYELFWRPFHWDKTEHGLANSAPASWPPPILSRIAR